MTETEREDLRARCIVSGMTDHDDIDEFVRLEEQRRAALDANAFLSRVMAARGGHVETPAPVDRDRRDPLNFRTANSEFSMGRKRTPTEVAEITGAARLHPGRYLKRARPKVEPIGEAPENLTEAEKQAWAGFVSEMPWLRRSDRCFLAMASRLKVRTEEPGAPISLFAQFRLCLASMGATPVDRSRIEGGFDDESDDPADEYFN